MNKIIKQHKTFLLLATITLVGAFLRFYKLDWGHGLFTHPDEYHIVTSVNQLSFPFQMHPHFFSYGTVTIYLIYFTQEIVNFLSTTFNFQLSTFNSFIIGRFYSALFSTLTIIIVYQICTTFMSRKFSLIAALLVALTPGLIQQAHFATPESALTFFLFLSLLFMMKFLQVNKFLYLVLASVFLGFALGVKVSSVVFLLPLVMAIVFKSFRTCLKSLATIYKEHVILVIRQLAEHPESLTAIGDSGQARMTRKKGLFKQAFRYLFRLIELIFASLATTIAVFVLVAPYVFIDYKAFRSNLEYEGGLAIGKISVFYTRQFIDTIPVLFQAEKILPYALGPFLFLFSTVGLIFLAINFIRKPKIEIIILLLAFLSLFLTNAFLFAKWTRFIAPTFPFFAIFAAFLLEAISKPSSFWGSASWRRLQNLTGDAGQASMTFFKWILGALLLVSTILWTLSFFSIYTNDDVRITASKWIESVALPGSTFLVEGGNMIDLPLSGNFQRTSLSFYDLEDDPLTRERIINALHSSDYFLVQSRRVFYNHQRLRHLYPKTSHFYDVLFDGKLGFEQIKEFHSYPTLKVGAWKLEFADEIAEETWSVFDHPVIRVFKKNANFTREDYTKFF